MTDLPPVAPWLPALVAELELATGLKVPGGRWAELVRGLEAIAAEQDGGDVAACARRVLALPRDQRLIDALALRLTVGETYFFRDLQSFDCLTNDIVPSLVEARRGSGNSLAAWSAGCASGEEAYSLAILLSRVLPDFPAWKVRVLGTDLNPQAIGRARSARYDHWSFRRAPGWLRQHYFNQASSGHYRLRQEIRAMVDFRCHNLVGHEPLPSAHGIDLILCRNVLMYLTPEGILRALDRLHQALAPDGWLLVSPAEVMLVPPELFAATQFSGTTLFRKRLAVQADPAPAVSQHPPTPPYPGKSRETASEKAGNAGEPTYQDVFALYLQGQSSAAKQLGLQHLSACPHDLPTLLLMVRIHANEGQPDAALKWCLTAIGQNPQHPAGHYLLALLHQEQGRIDEAIVALTEVLSLDRTFVLGHFAMAGIRRAQGRDGEMRRHVEQALVLLDDRPPHEVVAESEDMTAGHLAQILRRFLERREAA